MMRILGSVFCGCLIVVGLVSMAQTKEETEAVPVIEVQMPIYDFGQVSEGEVVIHDFRVVNPGTAPLDIKSVKPG
jgi:hypothetical protein